jgi:hypothetical protein
MLSLESPLIALLVKMPALFVTTFTVAMARVQRVLLRAPPSVFVNQGGKAATAALLLS